MTSRRRPIHVITEVKETRGADADEMVQAPTKDETPYQEGMVFEASDVVGVPDDGGVESAEVFSGRRYQLSGSSPRHWPTGIAERNQISIVQELTEGCTYHAILSPRCVPKCVW